MCRYIVNPTSPRSVITFSTLYSASLNSTPSALANLFLQLTFPHVDNTPDAVTSLHICESLVDIVERLTMGNELINLQFSVHVVLHEAWELRATLNPAEGAAFPYTPSDELECWL